MSTVRESVGGDPDTEDSQIFLGLQDPDPDPLVRGTGPDPDPAPDPSLFTYTVGVKRTEIMLAK